MKITIVRTMNKLKAGVCDYLNRVSKNWSIKKLKVYWFFFVLVGVAISLEICIHAIEHAKPLKGFSRPHTTILFIPKGIPVYNREGLSVMLLKIRSYELYLDSLSLVDTSKYCALLKSQPFLLDSLHALETLLSQNLKK